MRLTEQQGNLFTHIGPIAHCISADYQMGAGIAVEVKERYALKPVIHGIGSHIYPDCIFLNNVFNLVTKEKYWHKPTYSSLQSALELMRDIMVTNGMRYVGMPRIGCGLDRLHWPNVKLVLEQVFVDTDITITVYQL